MPSKILSCATNGLDCNLIEAEVDLIPTAQPSFIIVGLGDTAVQEAKERVTSAIKNSKAIFPRRRIVINLAPADLKKHGPAFDLPIAVGILKAADQINLQNSQDSIFIGELALNGRLRHVNGILPIVSFAKEKKFKWIFLPKINSQEASLISGIQIMPVESLEELIFYLRGEKEIFPPPKPNFIQESVQKSWFNMKYIRGQEHAKRALQISAAGAHNVLLEGVPGAGKTLLARTFPTILPNLTLEESLEVTKIYSIAGLLPKDQPLITKRPFRAVHHTASSISIVGGGKIPSPGEISLAHKGVLFLDEMAEFQVPVLEALRQPLEDKIITISRASGTLTFPAHFILIGALNPCPCGFLNEPERECLCSPAQISRYQKKLSGPLLDRIDLYVEVPRVKTERLTQEYKTKSSEELKIKIENARKIQQKRFQNSEITTNSEMNPQQVKKFCELNEESKNLLQKAITSFNLSARGYFRVIKTARTIADLEESGKIKTEHLAEALQYRRRDNLH